MPGLPYAVPSNYVIRLVETDAMSASLGQPAHPVQPHISQPSHFQFPRTSLHQATLQSHFKGPHAPGSVSAPTTGTAFAPATDIRETLRAYHIEIETPGVTEENKSDLVITWMSPHTLLVQGVAGRPKNIGLMDQEAGQRVWEGEGDGWATEAGHGKPQEETDGGPLQREKSYETMEAEALSDSTPTILLSERRVGAWRRTFTLPEDVEMKALKARLDGGLLRIDLPKRSLEDMAELKGAGVRIEIE
ncbi:uncharacterized protein Z520_08862 [Fonsecaea multimorphosa CBS 102226]|uniref:SHSP domain-containing protein n=1 Tax=Fonsecaea multimorphosa CBS 102226 TaxID=1442371 RepID=A0A0D2H0L1_9EURO|nr:uncharacterized protein Z520_08862 [Fonsecaea multimorphosa CBS 102226]KIX95345.1 hypothetical protein Z520_08862 [Fonsecaea multimorphosa CBS 102226]OAL21141.1 hypothetical protein AYO22_08298 [Fonsecaea multimorphosa]